MNFEKHRSKIKNHKGNSITKDVAYAMLEEIQAELIDFEKNDGRVINVGKVYRPDDIQKYDIVTSYICGSIHPCIVYDIDENYAYVISCTSTESPHVVHKFENSRIFRNKYMTNTMVRMSKQTALENFVGITDNKQETDVAFAKVIDVYKYLFKL